MIPPPTLYACRRLLTGGTLNGERESVSPLFLPLVDHLEALPPEIRLAAFDGFLVGRDDAAEVRVAMAAINLDAPAPTFDAGADVGEAGKPRFRLTRAADVVTRAIEWEWEARVPRGMLTLFAGDPKLGKSLVTIGLASARSRGAPLPGASGHPIAPCSVVLMSAEDDPARTIVPRLEAAGADLDKVHLLESIYLDDDTEALPNLRSDIDAIEAAIEAAGDCRLVVVDPVSAYIGGADDHKNSELRGLLSPLKALAERRDVAVVLITHLNKGNGTNAKHRVTGSIAYVGACRSNFLFVKDKDDPTGRRVFMVSAGCNLVDDPPTLAYRVADLGDGPVVTWEAEPVAITAEAALEASGTDKDEREEREERDACDEWLRSELADGRVMQTLIASNGRNAGFNLPALNRAKHRIGAVTEREGFGAGSKCYWAIPAGASTHHTPPS